MLVKTKVAIHSLRKLAGAFDNDETVNEDLQNLAVNTVIGCFHVVERSPSTDLRAWLQRKPHRKALKRASRAAQTKRGRRAIRELIRLALSELEVCAAFRKEVEVGPLPVAKQPGPRKLTPEHLAALRNGQQKSPPMSASMAH